MRKDVNSVECRFVQLKIQKTCRWATKKLMFMEDVQIGNFHETLRGKKGRKLIQQCCRESNYVHTKLIR